MCGLNKTLARSIEENVSWASNLFKEKGQVALTAIRSKPM